MGCQAEVYIGNNLTFSICTHDPDTAALTDASSPPVYRIYEDETATPILTGTMSKLDDAGTTGFYTEQIACTTGNGFEHSKSYTIYIEATVGIVTGGISYGFRALTGVALNTGVENDIADALLKRDWTSVTGEAARSVLNALRFLRNKWSVNGTTLTVTKEDDTATAWTAVISTTAAAEPAIGVDPS